MMKLKIFLFFILPLTLVLSGCRGKGCETGCYDGAYGYPNGQTREIHDEASELINLYALELEELEELKLCNAYVYKEPYEDGTYHYVYWVEFKSMGLYDVCDGRHLLVRVVEGLTERLNMSAQLTEFTSYSEITPHDVYVSISFESYFAEYIDPLYLARIELEDGYYSKFYAWTGFDFQHNKLFHKHTEPYFRSRQIVDIQEGYALAKEVAKPKKEEKDVVFEVKPSSFTNYSEDLRPSGKITIGAPVDNPPKE